MDWHRSRLFCAREITWPADTGIGNRAEMNVNDGWQPVGLFRNVPEQTFHRLHRHTNRLDLRRSYDREDDGDCIHSSNGKIDRSIPVPNPSLLHPIVDLNLMSGDTERVLFTICWWHFRLLRKYRRQYSQMNSLSMVRFFSFKPSSASMYGEWNQQSMSTCPNCIDKMCLVLSGIYRKSRR